MSEHHISTVTHLTPEGDGYGPSSPVRITYDDGRPDAFSVWGSDADGGGVLAWRSEGGIAQPYSAPTPQLPTPILLGTALLTVDSGDLGGVSSAAGLSFGIYMGVGLYWLFFSQEMADLGYSYAVTTSQGRITVTDRQLSYMELTVVDDAGSPVDPAEISLQLYRSN